MFIFDFPRPSLVFISHRNMLLIQTYFIVYDVKGLQLKRMCAYDGECVVVGRGALRKLNAPLIKNYVIMYY